MRVTLLFSLIATIIVGVTLNPQTFSMNAAKAAFQGRLDNSIDAYAHTAGDFDVEYKSPMVLDYIQSVRESMPEQCKLGDRYLQSASLTYKSAILNDSIKLEIDNVIAAAC
jgi:predicted DNA-binding protein (UPF0278 family)